MQNNTAAVDRSGRERQAHGSPDFPLKVYWDDLEAYARAAYDIGYAHWHPEIELILVVEGLVEYRVGDGAVLLHPGEGLFINTQTLHSVHGRRGSGAKMYAILFHPQLLARGGDRIYDKYVMPVLRNTALPYVRLDPATPWQASLLESLQRVAALDRAGEDGYELAAVGELLSFWRELVRARSDARAPQDTQRALADQRVKQMLGFIHTHFADAITLDDIARAASISKSECQRCFTRALGVSPVEYLIACRLEAAAAALRGSTQPVSDIALSCGFNSLSYFSKRFRETYGMTPLAYRKEGR